MKRMTGTVTLSFLEEDNRQRVLFRLIPLCTREGAVFDDAAQLFPDEGSLRIVPDKHEQSTFKERMRSMSGYCAIVLPSDGREQMKVRQNRNYTPQSGEHNQFALYSDVVYEFSGNSCFEVIPFGTDAKDAVSRLVLLQDGKMLYGPVDKDSAASCSLSSLCVFGNESFLLHTFENEKLGKRTVCWNPEAVLNWRQRRAEHRRQDKAVAAEPETPAVKEAPPAKKIPEKKPAAESVPARKSSEKAAGKEKKANSSAKHAAVKERVPAAEIETPPAIEPAEPIEPLEAMTSAPEEDDILSIGESLNILDTTVPFDQQISQLSQPISESANLLSNVAPIPEETEDADASEVENAHFNGTPLTVVAGKSHGKPFSIKNMPGVIDKQLRDYNDRLMGNQIGQSLYEMVDQPLETLTSVLDYVCQNTDLRSAAVQIIARNHSFCSELLEASRHSGIVEETEAAALEQLDEIEAERLSLLMQLKQAKEDARKYREEAFAALGQKKKSQITELNHRISTAEETKKRLDDINQSLSSQINERLVQVVGRNAQTVSSISGNTLCISPVIGEYTEASDIVDRVRIMLNHSGYSISDDEASSLVVAFSTNDRVILKSDSPEDAERFAFAFVESLGLRGCCGVLRHEQELCLISILKDEDNRSPTISIQPGDMPAISSLGHKTLFVEGMNELDLLHDSSVPVILIPSLSKRPGEAVCDNLSPISYQSFLNISAGTYQLLPNAEKWLSHMLETLASENIVLSDAACANLRHFITVGAQTMRGSFLSTSDFAVSMWIVPLLDPSSVSDSVKDLLTGFNHSLRLLNLN